MHNTPFTKTSDGAVHTTLPSGRRLHILPEKNICGIYTSDESNVIVFDDRHTGDPSFQILNSYKIRLLADKREILEAIIAFDTQSPSERPWKRTLDSLVKEWNLHNLAYQLHVYRSSSADVDLDNFDEGKGYFRFFYTTIVRVSRYTWRKTRGILIKG